MIFQCKQVSKGLRHNVMVFEWTKPKTVFTVEHKIQFCDINFIKTGFSVVRQLN